MTLEQLRALDAVVRYGSVRAAAEKIFKTPPSVSTLIINLEKYIGITLLSRDGYRPKLTPEGEIFYEKLRKVLVQVDELTSLSQRIVGHKELIVNIAINAVCPLDAILPTLLQVENKHPETQINVSTEQMGGAIERLKHNEAEISITTSAGMESGSMEAFPAFSITIVPVANKDHALASSEGLITSYEAAKYTQVIVRDSSHIEKKQTLDVIEGGRQCHVTDFLTKKKLIVSGLGWGGLPEYMIENELKTGNLVKLAVENFEVRQSHQYLVRRINTSHGVVAQDIWDALKKQFDK